MYPLNKANRLSLCLAMKELTAIVGGIPGWDRHIELLKQSIDIQEIIHEFRNKDIFFDRGLCGFYYLLRKTNIYEDFNDLFMDKIINSEFWVFIFENDNSDILSSSLYHGTPGVILTYLHLLGRSKGTMFHLTHSRGNNSLFRYMEQNKNTNKERMTTMLSSKDELLSDLNKS